MTVPSTQPGITLTASGFNATYSAVETAWTVTSGEASTFRYTFLYSADNGSTWMPISVHPDRINWFDGAFHYGVNANMVEPSNQARIRVLVSDGFHTAETTSAVFTVPDLGPRVGIDAPANNERIDDFPATFSGYAWDVMDGDRGQTIVWTSSVDGKLGQGADISVTELSVGTHMVTMTATDEDGKANSAQVRITVKSGTAPAGPVGVYLPTLMKR